MAQEQKEIMVGSDGWDDGDTMCYSIKVNGDGTITTEWSLVIHEPGGKTWECVRKVRMKRTRRETKSATETSNE